jgi:hypothetical protein
MCFALVGLYVSFLISSLLAEFYMDLSSAFREPCCIAFSALIHYFLLVYLLITIAQSILMYLDLVIILMNKGPLQNYVLKMGIVCWGK